jgi:8-oxo-dGTP diphosphatase
VCSQGNVIPGLLASLAQRDGMPLRPEATRKGSVWALSLHADRFVSAHYLDSPLPVR